jgi:hypothetical protein
VRRTDLAFPLPSRPFFFKEERVHLRRWAHGYKSSFLRDLRSPGLLIHMTSRDEPSMQLAATVHQCLPQSSPSFTKNKQSESLDFCSGRGVYRVCPAHGAGRLVVHPNRLHGSETNVNEPERDREPHVMSFLPICPMLDHHGDPFNVV